MITLTITKSKYGDDFIIYTEDVELWASFDYAKIDEESKDIILYKKPMSKYCIAIRTMRIDPLATIIYKKGLTLDDLLQANKEEVD